MSHRLHVPCSVTTSSIDRLKKVLGNDVKSILISCLVRNNNNTDGVNATDYYIPEESILVVRDLIALNIKL